MKKHLAFDWEKKVLALVNPATDEVLQEFTLVREYPNGLMFAHPKDPEVVYVASVRIEQGDVQKINLKRLMLGPVAEVCIPQQKNNIILIIPEYM